MLGSQLQDAKAALDAEESKVEQLQRDLEVVRAAQDSTAGDLSAKEQEIDSAKRAAQDAERAAREARRE